MIINGERVDIAEIKLADYLAENNYNLKHIVIELNGEILSGGECNDIVLKENDIVEILMFMGGGWLTTKFK